MHVLIGGAKATTAEMETGENPKNIASIYDYFDYSQRGEVVYAGWLVSPYEPEDIIFRPQTKAELQTAVDLWCSDSVSALDTYGQINTGDVSLITDMSSLFGGKKYIQIKY